MNYACVIIHTLSGITSTGFAVHFSHGAKFKNKNIKIKIFFFLNSITYCTNARMANIL